MSLNSEGGKRSAQLLVLLLIVVLIGALVYGVYEFLHWARILGQLD